MPESSTSAIRVGIVGANPDYGWGSGVHRRVLQNLPDYSLQAVCTTRTESAQRAAREFGAPLAFTDFRQLTDHPDIDLVSICVKAPHHFEIAHAALQAGKHVYCEWPLALTLEQAEILADLAEAGGAKAMIGLHLRGSPVHRYAAKLIADGFVGKVYSVNLHIRVFGPLNAAMAVKSGGTTLHSIYGGHLLDAIDHYFGGIADLDTRHAIHLPPRDLSGAPVDRDASDHIQFTGALTSGALFNLDLAGSSLAGLGSVWRIEGDAGALTLSSRDPDIHSVEALTLSGARLGETVQNFAVPSEFERGCIPQAPDRYSAYPGMDAARESLTCIETLYSELAQSIRSGAPVQPGFGRALRVQQLLAAHDRAPRASGRQSLLHGDAV